jgi:acyl-CoA reductase-like NAD-dependent aldehyde dehydrogenase
MLHIPVLRHGAPYESIDQVEIVHHATGEPVARVSQANPGLITRDVARMDHDVLDAFTMRELLGMCREAAALFMTAQLPVGEAGQGGQSFDDYVRDLSATTGMPVSYCRGNARKIHRVLDEMEAVIAGLTRGFDLSILDRGYGQDDGRMLSWFREARVFGAVLPSNSPGVHSLWAPAVALKTPVALKPGREEPWTPLRMIQAFIAAGFPREAFGFYPTDHGGAAALLTAVDRAMLFGDASTTRAWANDPRVELHGPGYSKVVLGADVAAAGRQGGWEQYVDLMLSSIAANGGRSCINASAIWTPANGRAIADELAQRLARVVALPADHPNAQIAAFANPQMAQRISASIDQALRVPGAEDLTAKYRGGDSGGRLVQQGRCAWLLPTVIWCADRRHPLANREFLFPFASVVECPAEEIPDAIGPSLVVTAITDDSKMRRALMASPNVDRLNLGPVPTWQLSWDQPHEGNLFEHLYRQRAFQMHGVAASTHVRDGTPTAL